MQKMDKVMEALVSTIGNVKVDRITMLPQNNSSGRSTASTAVRLVEELKAALGVDFHRLASRPAHCRRPRRGRGGRPERRRENGHGAGSREKKRLDASTLVERFRSFGGSLACRE